MDGVRWIRGNASFYGISRCIRVDTRGRFRRFHTAGATGSIPVPPTIQNKDFARLPEDSLLEFGTVGRSVSRRRLRLSAKAGGQLGSSAEPNGLEKT